MSRWITIKEASEQSGISEDALRGRCKRGEYPSTGTGRGLLIDGDMLPNKNPISAVKSGDVSPNPESEEVAKIKAATEKLKAETALGLAQNDWKAVDDAVKVRDEYNELLEGLKLKQQQMEATEATQKDVEQDLNTRANSITKRENVVIEKERVHKTLENRYIELYNKIVETSLVLPDLKHALLVIDDWLRGGSNYHYKTEFDKLKEILVEIDQWCLTKQPKTIPLQPVLSPNDDDGFLNPREN